MVATASPAPAGAAARIVFFFYSSVLNYLFKLNTPTLKIIEVYSILLEKVWLYFALENPL